MIVLELVATLGVSAASGLVRVGDELWIVADDELALARYSFDGHAVGEPLVLFAGELPREPRARKRAKPDLEALVALGDGDVLALGSGSRKNRDRGALVRGGRVHGVDLEGLYRRLAQDFDRLNVEGASVLGDRLVLLTRRTGRSGGNTLVHLDLAATRRALATAQPALGGELVVDIVEVALGEEGGAPYGFTDATPDGDALLFTAAAEATDDPYDDGACRGCIIGRADARGRVLTRWSVTPTLKLEGITTFDDHTVLVVADADDAAIASPLLRARLPV
ncbi:MAG: hypothetical protein IAG13_21885 [Deltaproteobacteria bacterium]|nr:hypothetical protein [Nannocystaceae bacterium]